MEQKVTVGNVCFIQDRRNGRVLLLERSRDPMKNKSTGVGGKTHFEEDIHSSCIREVKEETGLDVKSVQLKGVLKTILEGSRSSWLLFAYTADYAGGDLIDCSEGELYWENVKGIDLKENTIGFIRKILPKVLQDGGFIEGTIIHDIRGNVLREELKTYGF